MKLGPVLRDRWLLEDGVAYLNHGSFGATPRAVLAAQDDWRRRLEAGPVRFMSRTLEPALDAARARLAAFVGARADDLVFVDNATTGANAVLRSLDFRPGDEILTTSQVYPALRNTLRYIADRSGARIVEAALPLPLGGPDAALTAIEGALGAATRLLVVDHVTSHSAIVLPLAEIAALARARGVPVLVDGAHGPGMIELDIPALGVDWYVGNCHKWLMAPKGAGLLWAAPARQAALHPTVISHGYGQGFAKEFGWTGTRDPSAWLAVPAALDFLEALGPGCGRAYMKKLAARVAALLADAWNTEATAPPAMLGAMATIRLPDRVQPVGTAERPDAERVHDALYDRHRVEVPVFALDGRLWLRISAAVYNGIEEYERLAAALDG